MNRRATRLLLLPLLLAFQDVHAGSSIQGDIRFLSQREDAAWVGQQVELYLELWSSGFSFSEQLFVLPEVRGGYLMQTDSSTVKLNEIRNGEAWQGLRYTLLLYPQRAGRLEVPAFDVRFEARAGFGTEPAAFEFRTDPLMVDAVMPPGADSGGLIVSSASFSMEASWHPEVLTAGTARLKVGDALTLQVTRRAQGIPAMVFPPLPEFAIDGLSVYPESPRIEDRINRGLLAGTRADSITFVCEREGRFEIPGLRFQWWDPEREVLEELTVAPLAVDVEANPDYAESGKTFEEDMDTGGRRQLLTVLAWLLLAIGLSIFPGMKLARYLTAEFRRLRSRRKTGEAWAFEQVRKACRAGSPADAYNAISLWLRRWEHPSGCAALLELAKIIEDEDLALEFIDMQSCLASSSEQDWDGRRLGRMLSELRSTRHRVPIKPEGMPELNPR